MTTENQNVLRKSLYKEKPSATKLKTSTNAQGVLCYNYNTILADRTVLYFIVPITDMGENLFEDVVPAQLLWRWVVLKPEVTKPKTLNQLEVGDTVVRDLGGIPMPLKVSGITNETIECGSWTFSKVTGGEIDPDLGWDGIDITGSYIKIEDAE